MVQGKWQKHGEEEVYKIGSSLKSLPLTFKKQNKKQNLGKFLQDDKKIGLGVTRSSRCTCVKKG